MHPHGNGIKLLNKNNKEEYVLAPLRKYKKNFKKGDIIIFSAKIDKYENGMDWTRQYKFFMNQTQNIGVNFILISPTPTFNSIKKGDTCQEEFFRPTWAISPNCFGEVKKSEWFTANNIPISMIEKFLLENPKVSYIDAFSIICPKQYCKNHEGSLLLFKDSHHLSSYGAMKFSDIIKTFTKSK